MDIGSSYRSIGWAWHILFGPDWVQVICLAGIFKGLGGCEGLWTEIRPFIFASPLNFYIYFAKVPISSGKQIFFFLGDWVHVQVFACYISKHNFYGIRPFLQWIYFSLLRIHQFRTRIWSNYISRFLRTVVAIWTNSHNFHHHLFLGVAHFFSPKKEMNEPKVILWGIKAWSVYAFKKGGRGNCFHTPCPYFLMFLKTFYPDEKDTSFFK